ncbi:MAG: carbon storage regulator [Planctomycetaceae bacterium]|nr:carbon storage regulator [Planctomycetaceae bacterium]
MLILSRKTQEQIQIPGLGITLTVLSVGSNRVQLGIDAPRHIEITRPDANRCGCAADGRCISDQLVLPAV